MNYIIKKYSKYRDVVLYLFFGVCTTLVNIISYWICAHPLNISTMLSTIIAWILAVLFAYVTNREWVFHSTVTTKKEIINEIISFFSCRLVTGIIDWVCMFVFVQIVGLNDVIVKTIANIIVIILNYVASKVYIFRK